jgi:hypothetical protein
MGRFRSQYHEAKTDFKTSILGMLKTWKIRSKRKTTHDYPGMEIDATTSLDEQG